MTRVPYPGSFDHVTRGHLDLVQCTAKPVLAILFSLCACSCRGPVQTVLSPISVEQAPKVIGPYSQAIRAGDLVFCSGQVAREPRTGELVGADVAAQTHQVLKNLSAVLAASGTSLDRVVKTTVFLSSMDHFAAMNEVYAQYFTGVKPARATVAVKQLPMNALVEIDCIAVR